jgi:hypothetical protein
MDRDRLVSLCIAFLVLTASSWVLAGGVNAKFRDAVNFEDNSFVGISQVEVFHSYEVVTGSPGETYDGSQLGYQVTTGVMTNFELGVHLPVHFYDNGSQGIGDISLFQRFKFSQEDVGIPESSGGIELILPSGDEDSNPQTGTEDLDVRLFGTVGHSFGKNMRWLANGGVTIMGGNAIDDRWEYNVAVRYQPTDFAKFVGEINGHTGGLRDDSVIYASPGAIFRTDGGFNIMLSSPIGLTDDSADFKPTAQFAYEF